jgi:hypothetical protein
MDMWRILKPIMAEWYPDFESIEEINKPTNLAAHGKINKIK